VIRDYGALCTTQSQIRCGGKGKYKFIKGKLIFVNTSLSAIDERNSKASECASCGWVTHRRQRVC